MASSRKPRNHRIIEVLAVLLLGVATIGTAWCGYQASRWNGKQDDDARRASDLQVQANREFGLATQVISYDTSSVSDYAAAVASGNDKLAEFYRTTIVRPAFLPVIDQWRAQIAAGQAPTNLLEDQQYIDSQTAPYRATQALVAKATTDSQDAGSTGDDYVLTTILLASGLPFSDA